MKWIIPLMLVLLALGTACGDLLTEASDSSVDRTGIWNESKWNRSQWGK